MTGQQPFFTLLDILESEKTVDPERFFQLMKALPGVTNLAYIDLAITGAGITVHRVHHTFGADWERHYRRCGFNRIDPILKLGLNGIRPVDWSLARKRHPTSEPLFEALAGRGFPTEGIAYPLVGRFRRSAMLSINIDVPPARWQAYRRAHGSDFQHLASLFHAGMMEAEIDEMNHNFELVALTYRETEVLAWSAAGKSYWEISRILGIGERTVRHFMSRARQKLNVVSNTQAVAQAVWRNLIPPF